MQIRKLLPNSNALLIIIPPIVAATEFELSTPQSLILVQLKIHPSVANWQSGGLKNRDSCWFESNRTDQVL